MSNNITPDNLLQAYRSLSDDKARIALLAPLITKDEARHFRRTHDPECRIQYTAAVPLKESWKIAFESLNLNSAQMAVLVFEACKQPVLEVMSPFNAHELLTKEGFVMKVDNTNSPSEEFDGTFTYTKLGEEPIIMKSVHGFPDSGALIERRANVLKVFPPFVDLCAFLASSISISAGKVVQAPPASDYEVLTMLKKDDYSKAAEVLEVMCHKFAFFSGDAGSYSGFDFCHVLYASIMKCISVDGHAADFFKAVQQITITAPEKKRGKIMRVEDGKLFFNTSLIGYPATYKSNAIDHKKCSANPQTAYEVMVAMRSMRGDNASKKGELTRGGYVGVNLPNHDLDYCYLAADFSNIVGGAEKVAVWADTPNDVLNVVKSLCMISTVKTIVVNKSMSTVLGMKPYKATPGDMTAADLKVNDSYVHKYVYGSVHVLEVSESYITAGVCPLTKESRGDTIVIDRRKPPPKINALQPKNPVIEKRLSYLKALNGVFCTPVQFYSDLFNDAAKYGFTVYSSCEFHNLVMHVSNAKIALAEGYFVVDAETVKRYAYMSIISNIARTMYTTVGVMPYRIFSAKSISVPVIPIQGINSIKKIESYAVMEMLELRQEGYSVGMIGLTNEMTSLLESGGGSVVQANEAQQEEDDEDQQAENFSNLIGNSFKVGGSLSSIVGGEPKKD